MGAVNCARCGHEDMDHAASCQWWPQGVEHPCPCPGYRTAEQQEAWEAIAYLPAHLDHEGYRESAVRLRELLKAYP